ncbi:MAG: TrkH family potassium uptake protein [Acutalibacteraceae bacterium]
MNYKVVANILGKIMIIEGMLMILPLLVAVYYGEKNTYLSFIVPIALLILIGGILQVISPKRRMLLAKEGFVICGIGWIIMSLFGSLPFIISGVIPNFVDAFFETVSGFTTTGATIMTKIEGAPLGILFWRSFTHWIGGMGVLTFLMAIVPQGDGQSMNLMRAEVPGIKADKIVSKMSNMVRILYGMYFVLTVAEIILLFISGLGLYDAVVTAFSTAGTGGFSVNDASIAGYNNVMVEYVCALFMILFGVNFNLYFLLITRRFLSFFKNEELRTYILIIFASTGFIMLNIHSMYGSLEELFRNSLFTVSSIMSTTGFVTADFEKWPTFSKMILLFLTMCGACTGSTGGGMKLARLMLYVKNLFRDMRHMIRPRRVLYVKFSKKPLEEETLKGLNTYLIAYVFILVFSTLLLSINGKDLVTTFTAALTCFNNVGPGMAEVGATGNYAGFSMFSKLVLCFNMLAGRLEIFPILMLLAPATWKKR